MLPALLLLAAGWGLGCYFETNDDPAIILMLRGTTAATPVGNLHLYFHGFSNLLAALYHTWPALPWYGLVLYGLLYVATVLVFTVLDRLLVRRVPPSKLTALLILFFLTAWLEHGLWFNYVRVPVLLAGAGVLFAAQSPRRRSALVVGVVVFGLSWLIRPSIAVLGLLLAVPGACWLSGRRAGLIIAAAVLWAVGGAVVLNMLRTPQASALRTIDVPKANLNDYQLLRPVPRTATDTLGLQSVRAWMMADSTLVTEALFQRATRFDLDYFLRHTAPAKLRVLLSLVLRDYFPLLLLQAVLWAWVAMSTQVAGRRWFWLVQCGYIGLVLMLGVGLKLPPRLGLPVFDFWALSNLIFVFRAASAAPERRLVAVLAVLAVAAVPYTYKTLHRRTVLQAERQHNQQLRQRLTAALPPTALLVTDVLPATYKSASPFRNPDARPAKMLMLTGWTTADPSQAAWRQQLTGTRNFAAGMRHLAQQGATVRWLLTPHVANLLNQQVQTLPAVNAISLLPDYKLFTQPTDTIWYYQPVVETAK
ncbi:hypothetical protein J0X19_13320 [Hymenobacter sp. BT186]|uniref:Uncharacterized protein n=1 Tax=Hymenobacter telluris TaxID=2816474 RepID=A0A939JE25_9BACT|nr:hypothetical protein [Hymenobacter telluris]MBO0358932.1 hypothetical protein [Hymenobacter telluris]MBW3374958.1 hypothetical protein [Hymenobacter norwichensis]